MVYPRRRRADFEPSARPSITRPTRSRHRCSRLRLRRRRVGRTAKGRQEGDRVVDGFVQVARAGTGISLVARRAFDRMREPDARSSLGRQRAAGLAGEDGSAAGAGYLSSASTHGAGRRQIRTPADGSLLRSLGEGCGGEIWSLRRRGRSFGSAREIHHFLAPTSGRCDDMRVIAVSTSAEPAAMSRRRGGRR